MVLKVSSWDEFEPLYKEKIYETTKHLFTKANDIYSVDYIIYLTNDTSNTDACKAGIIAQSLKISTMEVSAGDEMFKDNVKTINIPKNGGYLKYLNISIRNIDDFGTEFIRFL